MSPTRLVISRIVWVVGGISLIALGWVVIFLEGSKEEKIVVSPVSEKLAPQVSSEESETGNGPGEVSSPGIAEAFENDRFSGFETVAARPVFDSAGSLTGRLRLVPSPDEPDRMYRVVDYIDPASGGRLLRQEVMRADSLVVAVPEGETVSAVVARIDATGFAVRPTHDQDAVVDVILPNPSFDTLPTALAELSAAMPDVLVEANHVHFSTKVFSNDYDSNEMWALNLIEAPAAWATTQGSNEVVVAVIDTGIDWDHPDLAANIWTNPGEIAGNGIDDDNNGFVDDIRGWNFVDDNSNPNDTESHGTHVSGTIGAVGNNNSGVVGVNWNVRLIALRAGNLGFDTSNSVNAMRYVNRLRQNGINVVAINASFGGTGFTQAAFNEIQSLGQNGVVFVAAAGNDGTDNDDDPLYPAGYNLDSIISVASVTHSGQLSAFSNFGATTVDIAAPGTAIRSSVLGGLYDYNSGTSMAAPHVTGAVALVAASDPTLSAAQIRTRILQSAQPHSALAGQVATGGYLNLRRAVAPNVVLPRVAITSPGADVVVIEKTGLDLELVAALLPENGVMPTASISWQQIEGPAMAGFSSPSAAATTASFPVAGLYRLRVNATSSGIVESDEITVAIGDGTPSTTGLRSWWRFDETSGNAADSSGEGRTGTVTGAARVGGVMGGALDFNGAGNSVAFSAPAMQRMTITAWARADTEGNSIFPRIVNMQQGLFFFGLGGDTRDGNGNTLKFAVDNGFEDRVWHTRQGTIVTNRLYQVAVTYDATSPSNNPRFYIDGVPFGVGVQTGGGAAPVTPNNDGFIGDRADGTRSWDGLLDEVRIFDRALTPAELALVSRENSIRSVIGGTFGTSDVLHPFGARADFSPVAVGIPSVGTPVYSWSSNSPGLSVLNATGNSVEVRAEAPGIYELRLDVDVAGRLRAVRTVPIEINPALVDTEGYYSGTTSDGAGFVVVVDDNGNGTFLGGGAGRGHIGLDLDVSPFGFLEFDDGDGESVLGVFGSGGTLNGLLNGTLAFSGTRQPSAGSGTPDPALDGIYRGWILDSGTRVSAIVAEGRIAAVVETGGNIAAAEGDLNGSGGFAITSGEASYAGAVAGSRINGSVTIGAQAARSFVLLRDDFVSTRKLASLSVRGPAGQGNDIMIAGFALAGAGDAQLLVRGIGPALEPYGVTDPIPTPHLSVLNGSTVLEDSFGWDLAGVGEAAAIADATLRTGAFELEPGVPDAALLTTRAQGIYTMHVSDAEGGSGTALAEVYDASEAPGGPRLVAVSSRSPVGAPGNIPIAGFSIAGNAPSLVLIRAVGPGLEPFGLNGFLSQPTISVVRNGLNVAVGAAWEQGESLGTLASLSESVGAFDLEPGAADASMLLFLPPGVYTAQVNGIGGTQGIVLLEVYLVEE